MTAFTAPTRIMPVAGRAFGGLLCLAAIACSTPQAPDRSLSYGFSRGGEVFRWPQDRLPVSYWVEDTGALRDYAATALVRWQAQFLYGEWAGIITEDSSSADVLIVLTGLAPPETPLTNDPPVRACGGVTQPVLDGDRIVGPITATVFWEQGRDPTDVVNCLFRVVAHEIGHTIGILPHADDDPANLNPEMDLMHSDPTVTVPSQADKNTVQKLYHTSPTLLPPIR